MGTLVAPGGQIDSIEESKIYSGGILSATPNSNGPASRIPSEGKLLLGSVGGGGIREGMGSAAATSTTEDKIPWGNCVDDDEILSLVGGWRLSDIADSTAAQIQPNNNQQSQQLSSCVVHAMPHIVWCEVCSKGLCRACSQEHSHSHPTRTLAEMSESLERTLEQETLSLGKLLNEVYRVERSQQDVLMKVVDALSVLKRELEEELMQGLTLFSELPQVHELLTSARKSLSNGNAESLAHLSALVSSLACRKQQLENSLFRAMVSPLYCCGNSTPLETLRLIHSYTSAKLGLQQQQQQQHPGNLKKSLLTPPPKYSPLGQASPGATAPPQPIGGPRFYFDMEVQGLPLGRIVIETRPDVAPKMCENFKALVNRERGFGFQGCVVFQCWKGESVITGDFEHNNGRGGHSIYEEGLFMPEDTRLPAVRGAIGMRRTQKRHDSKGLVGSQFRIILQDMPGFTGIFGHILDGIELVDKISECGDPSGNPTKRITIRKCGQLK